MKTVNVLEAKSTRSKLISSIESGENVEIVIARNGRPAARLVPLSSEKTGTRIGIAKGRFPPIRQSKKLDVKVAKLFLLD